VAGEALTVARRGIDLWHAGDLEAVYRTWDPEIVIVPDPYFPDSAELVGKAAGRRFWESQRESMGLGRLEILEEYDLGDRCLMRVRQHVYAPASGVQGSYDWSYLTTVREGKVVRIEFDIDRGHGLEGAGLSA
jgi:ketosteroid isomerase-like protein